MDRLGESLSVRFDNKPWPFQTEYQLSIHLWHYVGRQLVDHIMDQIGDQLENQLWEQLEEDNL